MDIWVHVHTWYFGTRGMYMYICVDMYIYMCMDIGYMYMKVWIIGYWVYVYIMNGYGHLGTWMYGYLDAWA